MKPQSAAFCALLLTASGCATTPPATVATIPAPPSRIAEPGTIVAIRRIPAVAPATAHILQTGLRDGGPIIPQPAFEFIVRGRDGAVLSVVQPESDGLQTGVRVSILRGEQTRIAIAPPIN
jgi:hypothetical protein